MQNCKAVVLYAVCEFHMQHTALQLCSPACSVNHCALCTYNVHVYVYMYNERVLHCTKLYVVSVTSGGFQLSNNISKLQPKKLYSKLSK